MEQINRIEIRGNIGFVRISEQNGSQLANFSVVTNYIYKGRDGNGVVETTWFNVVAWKRPQLNLDFNLLQKGVAVHVIGRMREREYTTNEGQTKRTMEVIANKISLEESEETLQPCRID